MGKLELLDVQGKVVATILDEEREEGLHHITYGLSSLRAGTYLDRIHNKSMKTTKKLVKK